MTEKLDAVVIEPKQPANAAIIWLHGLGADGHDFAPVAGQLNFPADTHMRYIFPHAPMMPVAFNGGMVMRAWFDFSALDLSVEVNLESLMRSNTMVSQLIEQQTDIPPERIFLFGFSQGGSIAVLSGLAYNKPLAGIASLSSFIPTQADFSTFQLQLSLNMPIFVAGGEYDPVVPAAMSKATADKLEELGHDVTWHQYPMQHTVCAEELSDLNRWINQILA